MSTLIPNENCFIAFATADPISLAAPTAAEVAAAVDLTDFVISLTASASGNVVPTPRLKTLFETSIPGTSTANFTAEMYRDDTTDTAWTTLPRDTKGVFYISRFIGTVPDASDVIEAWPVRVSSRAAGAMSSNTAQVFSLTCSVPSEPNEAAVVA